MREGLRERIDDLAALGRRPGLGTIMVGDDPGSQSYIAGKHRDCAEVGIRSLRIDLPADASQSPSVIPVVGMRRASASDLDTSHDHDQQRPDVFCTVPRIGPPQRAVLAATRPIRPTPSGG